MMINCREAATRISKGLDEPLSMKERLSLALHVALCPLCTEYKRQIHMLRELLTDEANRMSLAGGGGETMLTPAEKVRLIENLKGDLG